MNIPFFSNNAVFFQLYFEILIFGHGFYVQFWIFRKSYEKKRKKVD